MTGADSEAMTIKTILATTALAATLVAGGAAVADAAPRRQAANNANNANNAADASPDRMADRFAKRAVHGEFVVRTKDGFQTIDIDRGQLTSKDGNTLHIHRPDGADVTVTLGETTRFRGVANADALRTGKPVVVVSKGGQAVAVAQRPAATS
ncbi:MAG: hypothetical protein QOF60_444 [Actinomycetota bacterium]|jgi:hypothetical protein|nr:hypothetical protein [Actinomycetota bacterium]